MKKVLLLQLLIYSVVVFSQETISVLGGSFSDANKRVAFTVGETIIESVVSNSYSVTEGFHQPNWIITVVEDKSPKFDAIIFPNPSSDYLNIKTKKFENVRYKLFDSQSRVVMEDFLKAELTIVQVSQLPKGNYYLILNCNKGIFKSFNLIKN